MGLFDEVLNKAAGVARAQDNSQNFLEPAVLSMLSTQSGDISGLAHQLTANGRGDIIHPWISTGQNLPISPEHVQNVLGSDQVQAMATKAGISPEAASPH